MLFSLDFSFYFANIIYYISLRSKKSVTQLMNCRKKRERWELFLVPLFFPFSQTWSGRIEINYKKIICTYINFFSQDYEIFINNFSFDILISRIYIMFFLTKHFSQWFAIIFLRIVNLRIYIFLPSSNLLKSLLLNIIPI